MKMSKSARIHFLFKVVPSQNNANHEASPEEIFPHNRKSVWLLGSQESFRDRFAKKIKGHQKTRKSLECLHHDIKGVRVKEKKSWQDKRVTLKTKDEIKMKRNIGKN
jgi:hypothetical protein